jgi:hypothetical protein
VMLVRECVAEERESGGAAYLNTKPAKPGAWTV